MKISRDININVIKTVENAVGTRNDFHFYIDELTSDDCMATYYGIADEKYTFESMDDAFFEFLNRKIAGDGIYIRLILATGEKTSNGAKFTLECGNKVKTFETGDIESILIFDFADFGIKVQKGRITLGTTIEDGCAHVPFFAQFGSKKANETYLSLENPLNRFIIDLLLEMIVIDE